MKLKIVNQTVTVIEPLNFVSDTENVYEVEYEFGEEWEGYQKTAVFEGCGSSYNIVLTSTNKCTAPNEIFADSGYVRFGVLGTKSEGSITKRYPTVWSEKIWVDVASVGTGTPTPPTPEVYAQILANEANLADDIEELQEDSHTHSNKGVLDTITQALINAWTTASNWVTTNGANVLAHLADTVKHITASERSTWNGKQNQLTAGQNITIVNDVISATGTAPVSSVNGKTGDVVLDADDVGALPDSTVIPTKTSDLTNDSGFLTEHQSLVGYATEAWVTAKNYITNAVNDLVNYYTKTEVDSSLSTKANANDVYTKTEMDSSLLLKQDKSDSSVYISGGSIVGAINNNHEEISNLKAIGRFLAVWNCTTGLPTTEPTTSPYTYKTGDYFLVGTVGTTNYKPNGSTYTIGVASTTVETNEVTVSDYYVYDGTSWILLKNTQKALTFANITGQPSDNTALNTALSGKVGFTNYPSGNTAGVIKVNNNAYGLAINANGFLTGCSLAYSSTGNNDIISRYTLDNALNAKNINNVVNETFTFTLSDGTTVTKSMKVGS